MGLASSMNLDILSSINDPVAFLACSSNSDKKAPTSHDLADYTTESQSLKDSKITLLHRCVSESALEMEKLEVRLPLVVILLTFEGFFLFVINSSPPSIGPLFDSLKGPLICTKPSALFFCRSFPQISSFE